MDKEELPGTNIGDDSGTNSPIIVFPDHPRTGKYLKDYVLYGLPPENICLTQPLAYLDRSHLMKHAKIILTDSGVVQNEVYTLKAPYVTLRENTECGEMVESRWSVLVGADLAKIADAVREISSERMDSLGVFGNGNAAKMMLSVISTINN